MKYIRIVVLSVACLTASAVFGAQSAEPVAHHVRADDLIGAMQRNLKPTWPLTKIQLLYKELENVGYDLRYEVNPISGRHYDLQNIMDLVNALNREAQSVTDKGRAYKLPANIEIPTICKHAKWIQQCAVKHHIEFKEAHEAFTAVAQRSEGKPIPFDQEIEKLINDEVVERIKQKVIVPQSLPDSVSTFTQCKNHLFKRWYLYAGGAVVVGLVAGALVYYFKTNKKKTNKKLIVVS